MKRKPLLIGLLCGFCLLVLLIGIFTNREDLGDYTLSYNKTPFVLSENPDALGSPFALNKEMEVGQRNGIAYSFEPSISMEERARCIQVTDAILARLGKTANLQLAVYSQEIYDATFVSGSTVYTCLQDWKSPEYVSALLYSQFGEYCHYGAIYGYANYLCHELFDTPLEILTANRPYTGSQDALDLNLLCFHPDFTAEDDIRSAKLLANSFVSGYIQANGEAAFLELLKKSGTLDGMEEFTQSLTWFYITRNIVHIPSQLLFRQGGKSYAYIVKGDYATFYMEQDWVDRNTGKVPMRYDGFLRENYSEVKAYYTTVLEEMAQYQALFSLDPYNNDLKIYFANYPTSSDYIPTSHSIHLPYTTSLSLHYIEALVGSIIPQEGWAYNGTLAYFSYYYDHYGNTLDNYVANMDSDHKNLQFYQDFRQWLGRDIDIFTDYTDLVHFYAYSKGYTIHPNKGGSDSFIAYLISRFGEEKVIDSLCRTHDFGESFDALVADWAVFLKESYSSPKSAA